MPYRAISHTASDLAFAGKCACACKCGEPVTEDEARECKGLYIACYGGFHGLQAALRATHQPAPDLRAAAQAVVEDAESITYIGVCEVKTPLIMALREALNGD